MIRNLRSSFGWLALAALSAGTAYGQADQLPVSRTAGSASVSLPINQTTLMALPLVEIAASGTVTAVAGSTFTLSSTPASLPDVLTNPHALKITSRANQSGNNAYGLSARITAQSGQDVTAALSTAPNVGDEFVIYKLETLDSVFGATNTAGLNGASGAANADIVYVETAGSFVGHYYKSGGVGGTGWRTVVGNTASGGTIIEPTKALLVERKNLGSNVTIKVSGDALPGNEAVNAVTGFNLVNYPWNIATTLNDSGLKNFVTGASGSANADIIYLESGGVLSGYWYKNAGVGGTGWRGLTTGSTDQGTVALTPGKAILYEEKGTAPVGMTLPEPFAE